MGISRLSSDWFGLDTTTLVANTASSWDFRTDMKLVDAVLQKDGISSHEPTRWSAPKWGGRK